MDTDHANSLSNKGQIEHSPGSGQVKARQRVSNSADEEQAMEVDQGALIPPLSYENSAAVSRILSGRPLKRLATLTIQQIITLLTEHFVYGSQRHNLLVQAEQFCGHCSSDSTESTDGQSSIDEIDNSAALSSEEAFKSKYRFGFDDFSMNPFDKPHIALVTEQNLPKDGLKKLEARLKPFPYHIWVTKYAGPELYAICKYSNCTHVFKHKGNPTSSNIIVHLRIFYRKDYELFDKKLKGMQSQVSEFRGVFTMNRKPFGFRHE